jgi:hypothetical protein
VCGQRRSSPAHGRFVRKKELIEAQDLPDFSVENALAARNPAARLEGHN